jgi:hypothetical protein
VSGPHSAPTTRFTPFFLVYGAEVVLLTDLEYGSPKVKSYDKGANQRAREDSLDQLDEARTMALMHSARYQQALRRYQARKIRRQDFNEGDLVLRLRQDNRGRHKISPPWEGPYVVVKVLEPDTYKLANEDGRISPTLGTSNNYAASSLRKDFQAFFCCLHTQHTSWLYNCKSHREIKVKRVTRLSPENQVLLGGYYAPQKKLVPFFRKNLSQMC